MNGRKHSNEFKMEAVRLAELGDVPIRQVAWPEVIRLEREESVYPERYPSNACCFNKNELPGYLISLCEEKWQ